MNYRHSYHAGNFADVLKHAVLVKLLQAMQRKDSGFLFVDTHAGKGCYDLRESHLGDSLERKPEWPDGIGRLWEETEEPTMDSYLKVVRTFDERKGGSGKEPCFYPGSPWIAQALMRPQDCISLFEKHPAEYLTLKTDFGKLPKVGIQLADGYRGLIGQLPPKEKRALVLIDPSFEAQDEFQHVLAALKESLARLPSAVCMIWYPLTERAAPESFLQNIRKDFSETPALDMEMSVLSPEGPEGMKGCGLLILNPPWKIEEDLGQLLAWLASKLAQNAYPKTRLHWVNEDH